MMDDAWESIMHKALIFNVDLHLVDVHDVASPTIKLSDAQRHPSSLFNFLLENSLSFSVNETISFQKSVGSSDKTTIVN